MTDWVTRFSAKVSKPVYIAVPAVSEIREYSKKRKEKNVKHVILLPSPAKKWCRFKREKVIKEKCMIFFLFLRPRPIQNVT